MKVHTCRVQLTIPQYSGPTCNKIGEATRLTVLDKIKEANNLPGAEHSNSVDNDEEEDSDGEGMENFDNVDHVDLEKGGSHGDHVQNQDIPSGTDKNIKIKRVS